MLTGVLCAQVHQHVSRTAAVFVHFHIQTLCGRTVHTLSHLCLSLEVSLPAAWGIRESSIFELAQSSYGYLISPCHTIYKKRSPSNFYMWFE